MTGWATCWVIAMPEGVQSLIGTDIEAVRDAVQTLDEAGFSIVDVGDIDRERSDDKRVRWTMTVEAETRTASLSEFGFDEGDDDD